MANIQPRKNKDGKIISYSIRVHKGRDANNKQLKPYAMTWIVPEGWTHSRIEKEVNSQAILFEQKCKEGTVADNKQTFEKYALYVISLKERTGIKHRTIVRYNELLQRINPAIGHIKLADLRPQHLNAFYEQLSQDGMNKKTGKKLSSKTIIEHHRLIRTILVQAEKEMLIMYNSASKATPPKLERTEANHFEIEDIENILFYSKNESLKWQLALNMLIFTGCRRGEIMGLKWNKVDFKNNQIRVDINLLYSKEKGIYEDTPKTEQSKRTITIPGELIEMLKTYKKQYNEHRLALGDKWNNTGFLFTQENGNPMHPDTLTDYCNEFSKKYNKIIDLENKGKKESEKLKLLPHINPHAFRHTQASLLFFAGADCTTISKRLGHSKVSTTTDIYSHLMQKADETASDTLADVLLRNNKQLNQAN
jgi:integrase